jgi:hypothetical protein
MLQSSKNVLEIETKAGRENKKRERERMAESSEQALQEGGGKLCTCQGLSGFSAELFMLFDCLVFDYIYWVL